MAAGSLPTSADASTDGLDQKIRILRDDMLKQLQDLIRQEPSQDMVPVVDMLSGEATTLVQELQEKAEVCMRYEQFDLVQQIITLASEHEDLQRSAERWKAAAASGGSGGQRPALSPASSAGARPGASPAGSQAPGASPAASRASLRTGASFGPAGPGAAGPPSQGAPSVGASPLGAGAASPRPAAGSFSSAGLGSLGGETPESRRRREEEEADLGRRRMEEAMQQAGSSTGRSAISEAQRRQGNMQEDERRQQEEDRFGSFQQVDDRLPAMSDLGGLPAFGSSSSRRAPGTPSSRSAGGTPASRPQEQRRNEARQTLRTTLEGSMRDDPTVLQWALSEAQQAGVADVDPALLSEGERALERVQTNQREQSALQQLRAALDSSPRSAEALRAAIDEASATGLAPAQVEPALVALQQEEERSRNLAADERQRQEEERERKEEERKLKEAENLRVRRLKELREAAHGGDPDGLKHAIDLARSAGVAKVAIRSAEANLMAMRFASRGMERRPILRSWRSHVAEVRASRHALREAIQRGVAAEELDEAVDAASDVGVDETTCDMARTVASHRRSAHDQAACALASMDLEELHEAKAMNEAAGGPKMDVNHLEHAIAEAEEEAKMVRSWDDGLPAALDMYFEQLELEQQEAKARVAKASAAKIALEEAKKVATPLAGTSPLGQTLPPASEKAVQAALGLSPQQGPLTPTSSAKEASRRPATPPISRPEISFAAEEEWEREYSSMKFKVERARQWLAMQEQHQPGDLVQQLQSQPPGSEAFSQRWAYSSPPKGQEVRTSSVSRRRHVCGPDAEEEQGGPPPQQLQPQVPRSLPSRRKPVCGPGEEDDLPVAQTQKLAAQTQMPAAQTQMPAAMRTQSPSRVLPSRRRHVCGAEGGEDGSAAMPRTEALPSTAPPPSQALPSRRRHVCGAEGEEDHRTPPPSSARQDPLGQYHSAAARPIDQTQVWTDAPGQYRGRELSAWLSRVAPQAEALEERAAAMRHVPANPSTGPLSARSPVQTAWAPAQPARSSMPAATSPAPSARSPVQASRALPSRRRVLCGSDGQEEVPTGPPQSAALASDPSVQASRALPSRRRAICGPDGEEAPAGLSQSTAPVVEPKVQASRNMPSRYKPGYPSTEDLAWAPAHTQQSAQAKQSRPVLLGQQQPPAYAIPYSSATLPYEDPPLDYAYASGGSASLSNPGGPSPAPMVPGADAAGGVGYSYGGYEDLRGASTFHNLMANAARIARKPEVEPRRNYEDPTFWR